MLTRILALFLFCTPAYAVNWTATTGPIEFGAVPDGTLIVADGGNVVYVKSQGSPTYRIGTGSEDIRAFSTTEAVRRLPAGSLAYVLGTPGSTTTFGSVLPYEETFTITAGSDVYLKHQAYGAINLRTLLHHTFTLSDPVILQPVTITITR